MKTKKRNATLAFCAFAWIGLSSLGIAWAQEVGPGLASSEFEESAENQGGMDDAEFETWRAQVETLLRNEAD